jgi:predicted lactoylglutathione lyase
MSTAHRQVECTIPVLPVRDLQRSLRFYTETLEFKLDWGGQPGSLICSVSKDRCPLMLSQFSSGSRGVWVWIGVDDDSLFRLYRSRGVKVLQEPENHPWAYEMKFEDPDGNVLWLGTEARKDMALK